MATASVFVFAALLLLFTPGPTNTLLGWSGAVSGIGRSLPLLLAELLGYTVAIGSMLVVAEPVLQRAPQLEPVLASAVGCYVYYLAWKLWRRPADGCAQVTTISARQVFMVTLLNPKALVFALTLLPGGDAPLYWYCLALVVCILTAGFCWILLGHVLGAALGRDRLGLFNRCSSVLLAGFASYIIVLALP